MKKIIGLVAALLLWTVIAAQADQQFYSTQLWDVSLHNAGYDGGLPVSPQPTCDLTSLLWADRRIVFEYSSDGQSGAYSVLIQKKNWQLTQPTDPKKLPVVTLDTIAASSMLPYSVLSSNTLVASLKMDASLNFDAQGFDNRLKASSASQDAKAGMAMAILNFLGIPDRLFGSQGRPLGMSVSFQGNEPTWQYPESTPADSRALLRAFNACKIALVGKASELAQPGGSTSPMPDAGGQPNPLLSNPKPQQAPDVTPSSPEPPGSESESASSEDNAASADKPSLPSHIDNWHFSSGDEDWGKTCFVQATGGDVSVGFMGSPGKDFLGYIDGVFDKDTRASWRVDDGQPYSSEGGQNNYFGWYEFGDLPKKILTDIAAGKNSLRITTADNKELIVGLSGSRAAISQFEACFKK